MLQCVSLHTNGELQTDQFLAKLRKWQKNVYPSINCHPAGRWDPQSFPGSYQNFFSIILTGFQFFIVCQFSQCHGPRVCRFFQGGLVGFQTGSSCRIQSGSFIFLRTISVSVPWFTNKFIGLFLSFHLLAVRFIEPFLIRRTSPSSGIQVPRTPSAPSAMPPFTGLHIKEKNRNFKAF